MLRGMWHAGRPRWIELMLLRTAYHASTCTAKLNLNSCLELQSKLQVAILFFSFMTPEKPRSWTPPPRGSFVSKRCPKMSQDVSLVFCLAVWLHGAGKAAAKTAFGNTTL